MPLLGGGRVICAARSDSEVLHRDISRAVHVDTVVAGRAYLIVFEGLTVLGTGKCQNGCQDGLCRGRGRSRCDSGRLCSRTTLGQTGSSISAQIVTHGSRSKVADDESHIRR